ncbi:MAG: sugar phosphate isomerase/epimerase family protein [Planctomycetota bacterium]|jgi:sugar phosphate isomerase/epimerase
MKILASHFVESVDDDLSHIEQLPIQLAFYKRSTFKDFNHQEFIKRLQILDITVESVHAPAADVYHAHGDEFINMLKTIKSNYQVEVITVHPQRGNRKHARSHYEKLEKQISELGVVIAYETFEKKHEERKWITQVEDMHKYFDVMKFPFLGVTYDFTHSENPQNLKEVREYNSKIKAVHLSDARTDKPLDENEKHQHLPLGMGNYSVLEFLEVLKAVKYQGFVILEYLPQFRHYLKEDFSLLENYLLRDDNKIIDVLNERWFVRS